MYELVSKWARSLMAWPIGIAIAREAPESIMRVRDEYGEVFLITVGDVVTMNVIRYWRTPNVAFMDLRTRRERSIKALREPFNIIVNIKNEPATLSVKNIEVIRKAILEAQLGHHVLILVDGEEDLLSIPSILLAPRNSLVLYGLYTGYLVAIPTIEDYKVAVLKLLIMMRPKA